MPVTGGSAASPWTVIHDGIGYLAAAKSHDVLSDDVSVWSGPTPVGPWRALGRVATTPNTGGVFSYGGRVEAVPGAGLVVIDQAPVASAIVEPTGTGVGWPLACANSVTLAPGTVVHCKAVVRDSAGRLAHAYTTFTVPSR